jgi:YD repeat-containing protein
MNYAYQTTNMEAAGAVEVPARRGRPRKSALAGEAGPAPARNVAAPGHFEVVESYFGADGRPIKRKSLGAARIARSYDQWGNQVEEAYYNTDGKPTRRKGLGAARIHWRYDDSGNKVEAEFFGPDGALLSRENADEPPEAAPELA